MKTLLIALCATLALTSFADYRLKYQTTVDVLDESGKAVGKKTLKAGTVISLAETADAAPTDTAPAGSAPGTRLKPTDISPAMWKSTHPDHAVLRAEIELGSFYNWSFSDKKKSHWSVVIHACNPDWSGGFNIVWGYASRSSPIGKKLSKVLADGKSHLALVKVQPTRNENEDDFAIVEDFEIVEKQ